MFFFLLILFLILFVNSFFFYQFLLPVCYHSCAPKSALHNFEPHHALSSTSMWMRWISTRLLCRWPEWWYWWCLMVRDSIHRVGFPCAATDPVGVAGICDIYDTGVRHPILPRCPHRSRHHLPERRLHPQAPSFRDGSADVIVRAC